MIFRPFQLSSMQDAYKMGAVISYTTICQKESIKLTPSTIDKYWLFFSQKIQRHLYTFPAPIRSTQPVRERPPYPIIRAYWNITVTSISSNRQALRQKLADTVIAPLYHWLHSNELLGRVFPQSADFGVVTADAEEHGIRVNIKGRISTISSP